MEKVRRNLVHRIFINTLGQALTRSEVRKEDVEAESLGVCRKEKEGLLTPPEHSL
jgi:hypothetical protein